MKNHVLLDLIGEADEDYVLGAGDNVTSPRFRWKALAACAACAALILAAYPVYRAVNPPLHDYTVVEGGGTLDTQMEIKVPAGGADIPAPDPVPGGAYVGDERPGNGCDLYNIPGQDASGQDEGRDGIGYAVPGQAAPAQEEAMAQYDGLLRGLGGQGGYEPGTYPDWFGGAWIDNDYYPEAKLAVAIVDGFRTAELEAKIQDWCVGGVVFKDVKYSWEYLFALQDQAVDAITNPGYGLQCGVGVDVMDNCLGVDLYSDKDIPRQVLAGLARLDPDGDAIRVRVFANTLSVTNQLVKGPVPNEHSPGEPAAIDPEARATPATPIDGSEPAPGGRTKPAPGAVQDGGAREADQPAADPADPVDNVIYEGE